MFKQYKFSHLLLLAVFIYSSKAHTNPDDCYMSFVENLITTSTKIRKIFSDPENYIKYKETKGFSLLIEEHFSDSDSIDHILETASTVLGESFANLDWPQVSGLSFFEYKNIRSRFLDETGNLKKELIGKDGQALYAEKYHEGHMLKADNDAINVLDQTDVDTLEWFPFKGSASNYKIIKPRFLDETGELKTEIIGRDKQMQYAEKYHEGNMLKADNDALAVLDYHTNYNKIGWVAFEGSATEFNKIISAILNTRGEVNTRYTGRIGLNLIAREHYNGDETEAYIMVRDALYPEEFEKLQLPTRKDRGGMSRFLKNLLKEDDEEDYSR